jgi:glycosyltransferase involved in cell wall biosynthesis
LKKYNLEKRKYLVWVGRIVPDNHLDELVKAFAKTKTSIKCVIIGDDINNSVYKDKILNRTKKDKRFIHTGFLGREDYSGLVKNSLAYIETKRSGGTHPSLVEAMGFGTLIVCNDDLAHKEVLGKSAVYYKAGSISGLHSKIKWIIGRGNTGKKAKLKVMTVARAREKYSWRRIIHEYEKLFSDTVG